MHSSPRAARLRPATRLGPAMAVAIFLLLAPILALASGVTELVIFGDSLSDQGNVNVISAGVIPNDDYYASRVFSNGPPWIETLATRLGTTLPRHSLGGDSRSTNYAYGGAETGDNISNGLRDLGAQIDAFILDGRSFSPSTLAVLWIGGNDLNGTGSAGADAKVAETLASVEDHINEVIDLGASHLLIPNLPLLGNVPQHNSDPADKANHNAMSANYNDGLKLLIASIRSLHPSVRIVTLDIEVIFGEVLADPAAFGFTNVTDMAHTQGPFYPLTFGSNTVSDEFDYVFWDDLHPTREVHKLLGERAADAVRLAAVPDLDSLTFEGGDPVLSFASSAWDSYFLECSTDLVNWTTIASGVEGNGGLIGLTHEGGGEEPWAFYRVGVE